VVNESAIETSLREHGQHQTGGDHQYSHAEPMAPVQFRKRAEDC
jgi:hypothetical protein